MAHKMLSTFSVICIMSVLKFAPAERNGQEFVYPNVKVNFPIPYSQASKLVLSSNSSDGMFLHCEVQSSISGPREEDGAYSFMDCSLAIPVTKTTPAPPVPLSTGNQNGDSVVTDNATVLSYHQQLKMKSKCDSYVISNNIADLVKFYLYTKEVKILIINFGPADHPLGYIVWSSNNHTSYLLDQIYWYRLFSLVNFDEYIAVVNILDSADDVYTCNIHETVYTLLRTLQEPLTLEKILDDTQGIYSLKDVIKVIATLTIGNYSQLYFKTNEICFDASSYKVRQHSDNDSEQYLRSFEPHHFKESEDFEFICCSMRTPSQQCSKASKIPPIILLYKIILYLIWWLIAMPVIIMLPFHSAFDKCLSDGRISSKGDYYRIYSTNGMSITQLCHSRIAKTFVFVILAIITHYPLYTLYLQNDNIFTITVWIYLCGYMSLLSLPICKIIWECRGHSVFVSAKDKRTVYHTFNIDTFWGFVPLPQEIQIHKRMVPVSSNMQFHILYRLRLLFEDKYWIFCMKTVTIDTIINRISSVKCIQVLLLCLIAPFVLILAILNTLPVVYVLSLFIHVCRNRVYSLKYLLLLVVAIVLAVPPLFIASYTSLLFLYHTTSLAFTIPNLLPTLAVIIFIFDHILSYLRHFNRRYTNAICTVLNENQNVVKSLCEGKLASLRCGAFFTVDNALHDLDDSKLSDVKQDSKHRSSVLRTDFPPIKESANLETPYGVETHGVIKYNGKALCVNAKFHDEVYNTLMPTSIFSMNIVTYIIIFAIGYAGLDIIVKTYTSTNICCATITIFVFLGVVKLVCVIRTDDKIPAEWVIQIRSLIEDYYLDLYVKSDVEDDKTSAGTGAMSNRICLDTSFDANKYKIVRIPDESRTNDNILHNLRTDPETIPYYDPVQRGSHSPDSEIPGSQKLCYGSIHGDSSLKKAPHKTSTPDMRKRMYEHPIPEDIEPKTPVTNIFNVWPHGSFQNNDNTVPASGSSSAKEIFSDRLVDRSQMRHTSSDSGVARASHFL